MSFETLFALGLGPEGATLDRPADEVLPGVRRVDPVLAPILAALGNDWGISYETALAILAVLAGQSCAKIGHARHAASDGGFDPDGDELKFRVVNHAGDRFVAGAWIDHGLYTDPMSFCRLVVAAADHYGARVLPRIDEAARHCAETLGTPDFGHPRLPGAHMPATLPVALLQSLTPHFAPRLAEISERPEDIPVALAFNAQTLMRDARGQLDPGLAARILIECALPASRIHPDDL
jgi:hypothetical protein